MRWPKTPFKTNFNSLCRNIGRTERRFVSGKPRPRFPPHPTGSRRPRKWNGPQQSGLVVDNSFGSKSTTAKRFFTRSNTGRGVLVRPICGINGDTGGVWFCVRTHHPFGFRRNWRQEG